MVDIIRIIINSRHRPQLVVTLDKQSLRIHIDQMIHTLRTSPFLNRIEKRIAHSRIIDKIHKPETSLFFPSLFVEIPIDDSGNATHRFLSFISHKMHRFAEVKSRILCRSKCIQFIGHQRWYFIWISFVKIDIELHIFFQGATSRYFSNSYRLHAYIILGWQK